MKRHIKLALLLSIPLVIFSCSESVETVKEEVKKEINNLITIAEYGDKYPFKIDSLTVLCKNGGQIVIWQSGTPNAWAVNGTALQVAPRNGWGHVKDNDIWNGKPLFLVLKIGQELCNN